MKALKPPETTVPTLAVLTWKHPEMSRMAVAVLHHALGHPCVYPGDIPEDVVREDSRQGVASSVWGWLESAGILRKVPLDYCSEAQKIVYGRKRNTNPHARGRWTAVYTLASRSLAEALLVRLGSPPPIQPTVQPELFSK